MSCKDTVFDKDGRADNVISCQYPTICPQINIPYPIGTVLKINRYNQDIILSRISKDPNLFGSIKLCDEITVMESNIFNSYIVTVKYFYTKCGTKIHQEFIMIPEKDSKKIFIISDERRQKINEIPKILAIYLTDKDYFSNLQKQKIWNDDIIKQLIDIYNKVTLVTYCKNCLYAEILNAVDVEETWGDTSQDIIIRKQHKLYKLFCNDTDTLHPTILSEITTYNIGTTTIYYNKLVHDYTYYYHESENAKKKLEISKGLIDKLKKENKLKDQELKDINEQLEDIKKRYDDMKELVEGIKKRNQEDRYYIKQLKNMKEIVDDFNSDNSISYTEYISITANFEKSSLIIQRFYRGFICRKKLYTDNKIKKIITIQCLYRSYIARRSLKQLKTQKEKELNAAIFIQNFSRMRIQQVKYIKIKKQVKELEELGVIIHSPIKSPKNNIYTEPEPEYVDVDTYIDDDDNVYDKNPPNEYMCSITQSLMVEPVITSKGHTYEKKNIKEWFNSGKNKKEKVTDPLTGLKLRNKQLLSNVSLKNLITEWKEKHFLYSQKKD